MNAATAAARTATPRERSMQGFLRIDVEYVRRVRPFLGDAEARVYEALILECDGSDRPTSAPIIAGITDLHVDTVRRGCGSWSGSR
jgi:hypothetical protein